MGSLLFIYFFNLFYFLINEFSFYCEFTDIFKTLFDSVSKASTKVVYGL